MPRIIRARDQYELAAAFLRVAAPPLATPPVESSPPPNVPGQPGAPLSSGRALKVQSKDPINDPMGRLNNQHYDYDTMVDNLHSHLLGATRSQHAKGRHWYKVAQKVFRALGKDRGISPARAVAIGAAFSPLTDWGQNIEHASDFLLNYRPDDPDHNEHDWQIAHIDPTALQSFRDRTGRDPSASHEDLNHLADLHAGAFKRGKNLDATNDLSNPEARANWIENIQHHGVDKILEDHEGQAFANRGKKDRDGNLVGYRPAHAMRDSGIPTLGSNITKAKALIRAKEDPEEFIRILGGPKIRNFSSNILNHARISRSGYYEHPNGDWTQHDDLGGTIDAHHLRAAGMRHGEWVRKGYHGGSESGLNPSDPYTYDVFNRGLLEATRRYNAGIADPSKHITPKQAQAIIWIKHKDDNDRFKKFRGVNHESEITPRMRREQKIREQKAQAAAERKRLREQQKSAPVLAALSPRDLADMPPLWREMFTTRHSVPWMSLLNSFMDHHGLQEPDIEAEKEIQESRDVLSQADRVLEAASSHFLTASGYYDPDRERQEYMEHQKWLEENAEGLKSEDFSMTGNFPINPENFGRSVRDRLTRSSRHKAKQED